MSLYPAGILSPPVCVAPVRQSFVPVRGWTSACSPLCSTTSRLSGPCLRPRSPVQRPPGARGPGQNAFLGLRRCSASEPREIMNGDEVFLVGFQAMLEPFPAEHAPLGHDHLALDGFLQVAHAVATIVLPGSLAVSLPPRSPGPWRCRCSPWRTARTRARCAARPQLPHQRCSATGPVRGSEPAKLVDAKPARIVDAGQVEADVELRLEVFMGTCQGPEARSTSPVMGALRTRSWQELPLQLLVSYQAVGGPG